MKEVVVGCFEDKTETEEESQEPFGSVVFTLNCLGHSSDRLISITWLGPTVVHNPISGRLFLYF